MSNNSSNFLDTPIGRAFHAEGYRSVDPADLEEGDLVAAVDVDVPEAVTSGKVIMAGGSAIYLTGAQAVAISRRFFRRLPGSDLPDGTVAIVKDPDAPRRWLAVLESAVSPIRENSYRRWESFEGEEALKLGDAEVVKVLGRQTPVDGFTPADEEVDVDEPAIGETVTPEQMRELEDAGKHYVYEDSDGDRWARTGRGRVDLRGRKYYDIPSPIPVWYGPYTLVAKERPSGL